MAEFETFFGSKLEVTLVLSSLKKNGHIGSAKTSQGTYLIFDKIQLKPSKIYPILGFLL